jgi:16S rRNA (cytosine967-C5)-methyltransferase
MKLHRHLTGAIAGALREILTDAKYSDNILESLFRRNPKWGSRDRKFVAEAVYDIVRYYRLYSAAAESENNYWFMTACWMVDKGIDVPDWDEFRHVDRERLSRQLQFLRKDPLVAESYPDWLWQRGISELGESSWTLEAHALNSQAEVFLRTNTLKTDRGKLAAILNDEGFPVAEVAGAPECLRLLKRAGIFASRSFRDGLFEVQDAGSQQIGYFTDPRPGELVVDACAGAGGKSLHLAALMRNKGRVVSMDVAERKLEELRKRARRAGAFNISASIASPEKIRSLSEQADRVLLDVPCSGTGVIRRNPDTKWRLTPSSLDETKALQAKILDDCFTMVKPGGQLVYSTCSIFPSENHAQVNGFLERHSGFSLAEERTILPHEGFDGFYMARMVRQG